MVTAAESGPVAVPSAYGKRWTSQRYYYIERTVTRRLRQAGPSFIQSAWRAGDKVSTRLTRDLL